MPSLLGAFISIIMARTASAASAEVVGFTETPRMQAVGQLGGLIFCFLFALCSGLFTGKVMTMFGAPKGVDVKEFHDAVWWEIGGGEYELIHKEDKAMEQEEEVLVDMVKCAVEVADAGPEMEPTISVQGSSEETI